MYSIVFTPMQAIAQKQILNTLGRVMKYLQEQLGCAGGVDNNSTNNSVFWLQIYVDLHKPVSTEQRNVKGILKAFRTCLCNGLNICPMQL
jgi:hypothetical protein